MNIRKFVSLVFVVFSLYLLGDAFYRWDAFRYYAPFQEFLPAYALTSILWSALSVLTAILLWLLVRLLSWSFHLIKIEINIEHIFVASGCFLLFASFAWILKRPLWPYSESSYLLKVAILAGVAVISILVAWISRNNAVRFIGVIYERTTPLVWLFGGAVILSIPFVGYLALSNLSVPAISKTVDVMGGNDRPNIILITFDTLTARDMSTYGYDPETTPFMSEWAKSATLFSRHIAASNYTSPTTASLMTGKRVWTHRRFQSHARRPHKADIENVPLLLKGAGYYNMAFVANHIASVHEMGIEDSFMVAPPAHEFTSPSSMYGFIRKYLNELFGSKIAMFDWILYEDFILHRVIPDNYFKYAHKTEFPVENVFNMFMAEVQGKKNEPYFAWLHLFPPHLPYIAPDEYAELFISSEKFKSAKSQDDLVRPRYFSQEQQPDADILRARYDAFIRYCDEQLQKFIGRLEENSMTKNTYILLSSDHGESFEHGYFTHGGPLLYEQMTHVPLIIKEPGQNNGRVIDALTDQVDVPATILDLAGIQLPSWIEGRSVVPLMKGQVSLNHPVFSMNLQENISRGQPITTGSIAVWDGDYKMIYYIKEKKPMLFNLKEDPDELKDLYSIDIERGHRLLTILLDNLAKANERIEIDK